MDKDPSARRAPVTGAETDQLQREIEATGRELGDTVQALAGKADVKRQARRGLEEAKNSVAERKDEVLTRAREASPEDAVAAVSTAAEGARANPMPVAAAVAFAAGFVVGRVMRR